MSGRQVRCPTCRTACRVPTQTSAEASGSRIADAGPQMPTAVIRRPDSGEAASPTHRAPEPMTTAPAMAARGSATTMATAAIGPGSDGDRIPAIAAPPASEMNGAATTAAAAAIGSEGDGDRIPAAAVPPAIAPGAAASNRRYRWLAAAAGAAAVAGIAAWVALRPPAVADPPDPSVAAPTATDAPPPALGGSAADEPPAMSGAVASAAAAEMPVAVPDQTAEPVAAGGAATAAQPDPPARAASQAAASIAAAELAPTVFPLAIGDDLRLRSGVLSEQLCLIDEPSSAAERAPESALCPHCKREAPMPTERPRQDIPCPHCRKQLLAKGADPAILRPPPPDALTVLRGRPTRMTAASSLVASAAAGSLVAMIVLFDRPATADEALRLSLEHALVIGSGAAPASPDLFGIDLGRTAGGLDRAIARIGFASALPDTGEPLVSALAWLVPGDATWGRLTIQRQPVPRIEELVLPPVLPIERMAAIRAMRAAAPPGSPHPAIAAEGMVELPVLLPRPSPQRALLHVRRLPAASAMATADVADGGGRLAGDAQAAVRWLNERASATRSRFACSFAGEAVAGEGAAGAIATAMLAAIAGTAWDGEAVVLGGLGDDGKLSAADDLCEQALAAQAAGFRIIVVPAAASHLAADLAVLGAARKAASMQVIAAADPHEALGLVRSDRSGDRAEALARMRAWQEKDLWSLPVARDPACQRDMERILAVMPGHLGARLILARGQGKEPRRLSPETTLARLARWGQQVALHARKPAGQILSADERQIAAAMRELGELTALGDQRMAPVTAATQAWTAALCTRAQHARAAMGQPFLGQSPPGRRLDRKELDRTVQQARSALDRELKRLGYEPSALPEPQPKR